MNYINCTKNQRALNKSKLKEQYAYIGLIHEWQYNCFLNEYMENEEEEDVGPSKSYETKE